MNRYSFLNKLSDSEWISNKYTSFDILFLDMRNKTDSSIPIAMTYRYVSFLDLIEFMVKHKHGDIIDFSWEYRDSSIIFHTKENDFGHLRYHYTEVKVPDIFIGDKSDLRKYILDCTKAMATLLGIPYKPIDSNTRYSVAFFAYFSVNVAANFYAIDLDTSSLEFPVTIKTNDDKISVFRKMKMNENIITQSYINILRNNIFKDENELLNAMYRIR